MDAVAYREITACRVCGGSNLREFWNGGPMRIVEFPVIGEPPKKPRVPLRLGVCDDCWLVQLMHSTDPSLLYEEFWYKSGTNEMMRKELASIASAGVAESGAKWGDNVLDIGCNDGTMLGFYPNSLMRVGIDPAANLIDAHKGKPWFFICDYFSPAKVEGLGKFKIVTAIAMFYDLDDPVEFCKGVASVLDHTGVFIVQMNYLPEMLKLGGIDNVCHEHLTYFSLDSLLRVFNAAGLDIYKAELNAVNGGSIRVYGCHKGTRLIDGSIGTILHHELDEIKVQDLKTYARFYQHVADTIFVLNAWLKAFHRDGKVVYAYGASTRGTTLLQLLDTEGKIVACAERDQRKIGRYMVGADLPIVSEEEARAKADYFLVCPWHFLKSIQERECEWMYRGGRLIIPLPDPKIIDWHPWGANA